MNKAFAALLRHPSATRSTIVLTSRSSSASSQLPDAFDNKNVVGRGAGGSVRELGGAWGQREAAEEELYFRKLTVQQIEELRDMHKEEIRHLEKEMKEHAAAIESHRQKLKVLKDLQKGRMVENLSDVHVD